VIFWLIVLGAGALVWGAHQRRRSQPPALPAGRIVAREGAPPSRLDFSAVREQTRRLREEIADHQDAQYRRDCARRRERFERDLEAEFRPIVHSAT
jgi:hypothetical protein